MDEYNNFRSCVIREKKIFRSLIGDVDLKKSPGAITDYLEKHFKEKEAKKKQRQMMGSDMDELYKNKIQKMEEETSQVTRKRIDTMDF
jgi:predicted nuclease with TOPRIM domain